MRLVDKKVIFLNKSNFDFFIFVENQNFDDTIVSRFWDVDLFLNKIVKDVTKNSIGILKQHHWLNMLCGSQFNEMLGCFESNQRQNQLIEQNVQSMIIYSMGKTAAEYESALSSRGSVANESFRTLENLLSNRVIKRLYTPQTITFALKNGLGFRYYAYQKNSDKFEILLQMAAKNSGIFRSEHQFIFHCNKYRTSIEVTGFVQRALFDRMKNNYYCIDFHLFTD